MIGDSAIGLVLRLSAKNDASPEVKKFREDVEKELKGLETSGGGTFDKLAKSIGLSASQTAGLSTALPIAGAAIAGVAAVAVGLGTALFALAKNASDVGSAIKDASDKTGLSAKSLSALKLAADQSGSSLEAVTGSVTKFSRLIAAAADGSKEATASLVKLGLDPQKAINDLDGSLETVVKTIFEAKNPIIATQLATQAFGRSGADLIPVIKQMNGDFAAFKEEAKRLGVVLSEDDVQAADDFGDALTLLERQASGVATQFALGFTPAITKAMQEISGLLVGNQNVWREWGQSVGQNLLRLTRGVRLAVAALRDLNDARAGVFTGTNVQLVTQEITDSEFLPQAGGGSTPRTRAGGIDLSADKAAKDAADAAEQRRKEREDFAKREFSAQIGLLKAHLADVEKEYGESVAKISEKFKESGNADAFGEAFNAAQSRFVAEATAITLALEEAEKQQSLKDSKTASERQLTFDDQVRRREEFQKKIEISSAEATRLITENEKKESDNRVKITEDEANRKIQIGQASVATRLAQLNLDFQNKLITDRQLVEATAKLKLQSLQDEKTALLAITATEENRIPLKQKILLLDEQIAQQRIANASAVLDVINRETAAEAEHLRILNEHLRTRKELTEAEEKKAAGKPDSPGEANDFSGGLLGGALQGLGVSVKDMLEKVEPLKGIGNIIGSQFNQIASAVGNAVKAFVLFGSVGGSFRKFAAEVIASIAQMAIIQAVFELAQGFAMLALNFFIPNPKYTASATAHFTAAGIYGAIGGVAAIAGRAIAGDSFKQQSSGAFGTAGGGGQGGNGQTNSRGFTGGQFSDQGDNVTTFSSAANAPFSVVRHEIDLTDASGRKRRFVHNAIKDNVDGNGDLRDLFQKMVNDF